MAISTALPDPLDDQLPAPTTPSTAATVAPTSEAPVTTPVSDAVAAATTPPQTAEAATREVQNNELISHNLNQLLDKNGQYIQTARKQAVNTANRRGLQNSSLAATAGEAGAISSALPIATGDAQAYQTAAGANQAETGATNRFNADAANVAAREEAARRFQEGMTAEQFENDLVLQQRAGEIDAMLASNQFDYNQVLAQMDIDSRASLQQMQNDHALLTQNNEQANTLVRGAMASIAAIVTTPGLSAQEINRAIDIIMSETDNQLTVMDSDLSMFLPITPSSGTGQSASASATGANTTGQYGGMAPGQAAAPRGFDTSPGAFMGEIRTNMEQEGYWSGEVQYQWTPEGWVRRTARPTSEQIYGGW